MTTTPNDEKSQMPKDGVEDHGGTPVTNAAELPEHK